MDKLDKDATGLLLFTNDSDLSKKLNHPRFQSKKLYHVELNKPVTQGHLKKLQEGVDLEDGKERRVLRGGDWFVQPTDVNVYTRFALEPQVRGLMDGGVGFRCVMGT